MNQLYDLSQQFPDEWVKKAPKGKFGNFIPHSVIAQRLIEDCGPFNQEIVELIREEKAGKVVGCFGRLTVEVDGKEVTVTAIGDVENDQGNDGTNAKHAESDAFKRCAMKIGLGLHLWAGDEYYLDKKLSGEKNAKKIKLQSAQFLSLPFLDSKIIVTGPSLCIVTFMSSPKIPCFTIP